MAGGLARLWNSLRSVLGSWPVSRVEGRTNRIGAILAGTTDHEVAEIMGWAPERVSHIRRVYVDQARVVVAIGERIAVRAVN